MSIPLLGFLSAILSILAYATTQRINTALQTWFGCMFMLSFYIVLNATPAPLEAVPQIDEREIDELTETVIQMNNDINTLIHQLDNMEREVAAIKQFFMIGEEEE